MTRPLSNLLLPFLILSPFLIILGQGEYDLGASLQHSAEWGEVLLNTFLQSSLSAALAILLGFTFCFGLLSLPKSSKKTSVIRVLYLLPAILPPISVVVSFIRLTDLSSLEITDLPAIVLVHGFMNAGLVSLSIESVVRDRLTGFLQAAEVLGASRVQTVFRVLLPLLKPTLFSLFVLVFGFCLLSFVVPLMLAPSSLWSLEVLIFKALKNTGRLDLALGASVLQMLVVLSLIVVLYPKRYLAPSRLGAQAWSINSGWVCSVPILITLGILLLPLYEVTHISALLAESEGLFFMEWFRAFRKSLLVMLSSLLVGWVLYIAPQERLHHFLNSSVAFSPVLVGFSFWLLGFNFSPISELKIGLAIALFFLPVVYRWQIGEHLQSLKRQMNVARSLGATDWQVFNKIVMPQSQEILLSSLGLIALWAAGDFVMTSLLSFSTATLPMLVETLSTSYRLGLAQLTSMSILMLGGLGFALVWTILKLYFGGNRRRYV